MSNLWRGLEALAHGHCAVAGEWQREFGADFAGAQRLLLSATGADASAYPCPAGCGCAHRIVTHGDGSVVGVCECDEAGCDDLKLTKADVALWAVNWTKLGRALAKALGCDAKEANLGIAGAVQIASFAGAALPVVLVICCGRGQLRGVVVELVARLRERFVVLTPTSRFWDATIKELLEGAKAGAFDLESHTTLTPQGALHAVKAAGELFSRFLPEAKEPVPEDVARQAFALIKALDSETKARKAPVLTVFRLYCMEELPADEVAKRCGCSKGTIINRLELIRQKTGTDPDKLRAYSNHLEKVDDEMRDPRAKRIHRKDLLDAPKDEEDEQD